MEYNELNELFNQIETVDGRLRLPAELSKLAVHVYATWNSQPDKQSALIMFTGLARMQMRIHDAINKDSGVDKEWLENQVIPAELDSDLLDALRIPREDDQNYCRDFAYQILDYAFRTRSKKALSLPLAFGLLAMLGQMKHQASGPLLTSPFIGDDDGGEDQTNS